MDNIFLIVYFVLAIVWIVLLIKGSKKYSELIEPLEHKKYLLKAIYPIGFEIIDLVHYPCNSNLDIKRRRQCTVIYGEKYGEYYFRVNLAEKISYFFTFTMISFLLGPLFENNIFILFGIVAAGVMVYYSDTKITDIMDARSDEINGEFCNMVSKMALLINAGMITKEAWTSIADSSEGVLAEEMKRSVIDMENGVSEIDAYISFGERCDSQMVMKFISMLVQNLSKGNRELVAFLQREAELNWEERKHYVKRKGEAASNKLMLPLALIFVGILIMILVPIASKIGF